MIASKQGVSASVAAIRDDSAPAVPPARRRSPARRDSKAKLERIIAAAILLIEDKAIADLSMSMIAEAADIPRTSIYDFFPTVFAVYEEVARRHVMHSWYAIREEMRQRAPQTLAEAVDACVDAAVHYFNAHSAARKTLLGTGSLELHVIDSDYDALAARMYREFASPAWPVEPFSDGDPLRTLPLLQSAIYMVSVRRHGIVTPAMAEECKLMSHAYLEATARRFAEQG